MSKKTIRNGYGHTMTTQNFRPDTASKLKRFAERHRLKKIDAVDVCIDIAESLPVEEQAAAIRRQSASFSAWTVRPIVPCVL